MARNETDSGVRSATESAASVVPLIRRQAEWTPDALAIRSGGQTLTYRELDVRSSQLANYLRSKGVAPGSVVALCLNRSKDFPISALGVLKTGAAYLPLDPTLPERRLRTMVESAQVVLVIVDSTTRACLPAVSSETVDLNENASRIDESSGDFEALAAKPGQAAYVIFTSGSTGTPKPVAVGHDSLLNLVHWHNRAFNITATDRATQLASIGFDAAVWELWPYLTAGASVHFVDDEVRTDPHKLRDVIVREKITLSFAPTPLAEHMLKLPWPKESALRFLLTGADTLHFYPVATLPFALVNNYGPTECTVVATSGVVAPSAGSDKLPPIGRPIDNIELYILDSDMRKVAPGAIGEIYVGGRGLALGYLNDPILTAQKFVTNPFGDSVDAKLYRTGDLGSFLSDGQIAFHGRADEQVKINGFRVELNEVASALRRHPAMRETVVSVRENESGEKQLVAYIVLAASTPRVSELREFLAAELPEYMLPVMFVKMETLPVAISGKFDRRALPAPNPDNILRDEAFQHPNSITEQRTGAIVASLLGLKHVGVNDNFFYLGGNSLFGTQLIARLRDAFDVEVPLLKLFDNPTVAELSAEIERMMLARLENMSEEEAQRMLATDAAQASL